MADYPTLMRASPDSAGSPKRRKRPSLLKSLKAWFTFNVVALTAVLAAHFALGLSSIKWWPDVFAVSTNLLAGGLVSFLFYYLVVYLPETRNKSIIKSNLLKIYRGIKRDVLFSIIYASIKGGREDLDASFELVERLTLPSAFREAFQHGSEADEGFYAFESQMSSETPEFRAIVKNLSMLSQQVEFVLHNYTIEDQEVFDFFKRLQIILLDIKEKGAGYDESKPLCRFIWEMYAGWNLIQGDIGQDPIQKMIDGL